MSKSGYALALKRRREGKTNYKKRLAYLMSDKPRLVVRITNTQFIAQIVKYAPEGDITLVQFNSSSLKRKFGWDLSVKNLPSAYLTGYVLGHMAKKEGIEEVILDVGLRKPHRKGRIYALVKGVMDAGVYVPHDPTILPDEERLKGEHITKYMGVDVTKKFEEAKKKIEEYFSKG